MKLNSGEMHEATQGERIFWFNVDIVLLAPLAGLDPNGRAGGELVGGGVMEFGVTASDEPSARRIVEEWVRRSEQFRGLQYRIDYDYVGEIAASDIHREIYADDEVVGALEQDPKVRGLWYRTGVGWYDVED